MKDIGYRCLSVMKCKKNKFGCNIFKNNNLPIGQWQLYDTA